MSVKKTMFGLLLAFALSVSVSGTTYAGWVNGYWKDGTYVSGYWRSDANGLKYDNYSFDGDWSDAFNDSYYSSSKNYSSDWYTPSWVTQDDYSLGQSFYNSRDSYKTYSHDLFDYDYSYWDDPIYNYTPSYNYGYDTSSLRSSSYTSPYSSSSLYDYDYSTPSYSNYSTPSYNSYNSYDYTPSYNYNSYNSYSSPYSSYYDY